MCVDPTVTVIKNIRLGIIGLGNLGRVYTEAIAVTEGVELIAGCDIYGRACSEYIKKFSVVPVYSSSFGHT